MSRTVIPSGNDKNSEEVEAPRGKSWYPAMLCNTGRDDARENPRGIYFRRRNGVKGMETNSEEGDNKEHAWETASLLSGWIQKGKMSKLSWIWTVEDID